MESQGTFNVHLIIYIYTTYFDVIFVLCLAYIICSYLHLLLCNVIITDVGWPSREFQNGWQHQNCIIMSTLGRHILMYLMVGILMLNKGNLYKVGILKNPTIIEWVDNHPPTIGKQLNNSMMFHSDLGSPVAETLGMQAGIQLSESPTSQAWQGGRNGVSGARSKGWWVILLVMEEIRLTTKDDDYPIIYRVLTISGGAEFCPSTVLVRLFRVLKAWNTGSTFVGMKFHMISLTMT